MKDPLPVECSRGAVGNTHVLAIYIYIIDIDSRRISWGSVYVYIYI